MRHIGTTLHFDLRQAQLECIPGIRESGATTGMYRIKCLCMSKRSKNCGILQVLSRAETSAEIDETGSLCGLGCARANSVPPCAAPSTRRVGRRCQQSLSEASMLPGLSILILQGRLANINTGEWLRVAPAACMLALQRPWIYRGNGHLWHLWHLLCIGTACCSAP